jgi:hypothetical protein
MQQSQQYNEPVHRLKQQPVEPNGFHIDAPMRRSCVVGRDIKAVTRIQLIQTAELTVGKLDAKVFKASLKVLSFGKIKPVDPKLRKDTKMAAKNEPVKQVDNWKYQ